MAGEGPGDPTGRSGAADDPPVTHATEDEGGTEVVGGRDAVEPAGGLPTETRLYGTIGAFYLLIAIIYGVTSREPAGTALLLFASLFALVTGAYFGFKLRGVQAETAADEWPTPTDPPRHEGLYLPHTSVWPLGIGVGLAVTLAGIPIGWWFSLPGLALLVHSIIGFATQSRDRT
jgi:hypothetical protein